MNNRLSRKEYWNDNYIRKVFLPVKLEPNSLDLFSLDELFKKHLVLKKKADFIELGCAPGGWMYYFHHFFGLNVSGIEYAEKGVSIVRNNMKMLGIDAEIIAEDIFKYEIENRYDIVFSAGLIEHFYDASLSALIQKHKDLVKEVGYMILLIPNFQGWNYFYQKLINSKNSDIHNLDIMQLGFFDNLVDDEFEKVFIGYAGKINWGLYAGNKFFGYMHTVLQMIVNFMFFRLKVEFWDSKLTSPYILAIYRRQQKNNSL